MLLSSFQFLLTTPSSNILPQTVLEGTFKVLILGVLLLYLLFSFVVIRQVSVVRKTLITPFSPALVTMGWVHFGIALFVFVFMLAFL